jgi:hypothetical protein
MDDHDLIRQIASQYPSIFGAMIKMGVIQLPAIDQPRIYNLDRDKIRSLIGQNRKPSSSISQVPSTVAGPLSPPDEGTQRLIDALKSGRGFQHDYMFMSFPSGGGSSDE